MWVIDKKTDGTFYLVYDKARKFNYQLRGLWELIGRSDREDSQFYVRANQQAGYWVLPDDEGNNRMLVLE